MGKLSMLSLNFVISRVINPIANYFIVDGTVVLTILFIQELVKEENRSQFRNVGIWLLGLG
jgi:hypothetical protein